MTKKLGGVNHSPKGHAATQRDLNRLERWTDNNFMKFSEEKCGVHYSSRSLIKI